MSRPLNVLAIAQALSATFLTFTCTTSYGQVSRVPLSDVTGNAGSEMRRIYGRDIGTGYTVDSLNKIALQNAKAQVPRVGQTTARNTGLGPATFSPSRSSKPFNDVGNSPTVSPYMNLFREDLDGFGDFNYQTLVRPQLNQLQLNQQFQSQNVELNRRVQSISAQRDQQNPAGSESIYPTGHQTVFGYHGRYYPGMNQQQRKR